VACSLKKLGYTVYSADYFGVMDLRICADRVESVLDQKPQKSCGRFTERFNPIIIEEMALEMVDDVDGVICCTGVSPDKFPSHKVIGNFDVRDVEDKSRLFWKLKDFQKIKDDFNIPDTYLITDIHEAREIATNSPEKKFILKPRSRSGGYGVRMFQGIDDKPCSADIVEGVNGTRDIKHADGARKIDDDGWILQEFIQGENISASVLSTKNDAQTILTSSQIIADESLGQIEPFGYCGNMVPYTGDTEIFELAQKMVSHLSLIGSNGVDFISRNGEVYVVEVNPRLQGTFECAEMALGVNMADLHLEACKGHLMKVPPPERFAVKMIIHAHKRSQVGNINFKGVCDLPNPGVIIEKGEPLATVLSSGRVREDAIYSAKKRVQRVYKSVKTEF
jgi:hypothetical protein